ncbi:MAG TPA: ATP-binding cassette domain-containing protein [Desulfuromonadales bacterium]|nr:ATP-binding cassette domain-containing protein [Desulfuromonadales bacterium]
MEPILALHHLEYRRGDRFTLSIDRLDFQAGRIYLLAGPNGAGKSTLLQMLGLLLPPDRGEIRFAGTAVQGAADRQRLRRQITLVEQSPFMFDGTVYDNLAFGLRLRDVRGDLQRHRILSALEKVGLGGFESRPARALSGGETRRVALARAMVLRPKVLLLDEPTAGLDRESLPLFENCLAALPGEGVTVIISTHDTDQSQRLRGEVLRLEAGRLISPKRVESAITFGAVEGGR